MSIARALAGLLLVLASNGRATAMQGEDIDVRRLSRDAGACLAEKRPQIADILLRMTRTPAELAHIDKMAADGIVATCLGDHRQQLDVTMLRGSIAEARYRREFPAMPEARSIAAAEPVIPDAADRALKLRYWFAQCLVRASAAGADTLVRSAPGSPSESAGIAAIAPAFSGYLPKDMTAKFSRPELRALVSEAVYRAATTSRNEETCRRMSLEEAVRDKRTCPAISIPNANLIQLDDYPDASLSGETGEVAVQFSVGIDGKVEPGSCVVTRSSGHERLDKNSCAIATARFRFRPALLDGKPVSQVKNHFTRYAIPGER